MSTPTTTKMQKTSKQAAPTKGVAAKKAGGIRIAAQASAKTSVASRWAFPIDWPADSKADDGRKKVLK